MRGVTPSEVARDVERHNAELVTSMMDQSALDRVFSSSASLSTDGIRHMVVQVRATAFCIYDVHCMTSLAAMVYRIDVYASIVCSAAVFVATSHNIGQLQSAIEWSMQT
jgi:hypothetical protein